MNNEHKVILFDLGRVLMNIDFEAFPNALGLFTKEQRAPFEVPVQKIIFLYELGKITTEEFLDTLYLIFEERFTRGQILEAFDAIIVNDNPEIIHFVQSVQKKYSIAVLSNTSPSHWEKILRVSSLIKLFPNTFTSFQLGALKPEKIVYEKVCQALKVQPHEVLFIDDLKENIDGAIAAGMHGVVFRSIDSIKYLMRDEN
jgi:HAD superfamily hydrolase (TIGR01509 family)